MWWINKFGNVSGPYSEDQIRKLVQTNRLTRLHKISEDKVAWTRLDASSFWQSMSSKSEEMEIHHRSTSLPRLHMGPAGNVVGVNQCELEAPSLMRDNNIKAVMPPISSESKSGRRATAFAPKRWLVIFMGTLAACLAAVLCSVMLLHGVNKPGAEGPLSSVYQKKQRAIGLVTFTLQARNGNWYTIPVGTAFAIGKNKFVTNAHVAYGVRNGYEDTIANEFLPIKLRDEAMKQNKSLEEYVTEIGESGVSRAWSEVIEELKINGVKVRDIEVRLNHSNGKRFRVSKVQVHPSYNPSNSNGEFDVAIFEVLGSTDCYFAVATKKELYALQAGIHIASAGFPSEGLNDLNVEKPEASYATGDIKKITDFDNKDAGGEGNRSIVHSIPAAGGASGSPIFTANGKVIAVLWGVHHQIDGRGNRMPSGVLQNYAVRIDQIKDVGDPVTWKDWVVGPTNE